MARPDLIVANGLGGGVSVLLGNGFGGFRAAVDYAAGVVPLAVVTADVNGDGRLDLIVADYDRQIDVLLGDGAGGFGPATHYTVGGQIVAVSAVDVNGDGRPDIVATSSDGSEYVLLNNSAAPGSFTPAAAAGVPGASTDLVVDTTAPTVLSDTASPAAGIYGATQAITFTLATSEPVIVSGTPVLTLNDGGTASYVSGSGTTSLVFSTVVAVGQNAPALSVTGVALPAGAAMQDAAGNAADLTGAIATFAGLAVDTAPPSIIGTVADQGVADNGTIRPFASVLVLQPGSSPTETATITLSAAGVASDADGLLAGTGLTRTGVGTYVLAAGSPMAVTAALRALVFTPTANQVTPGASVTTGFSLSVSDGAQASLDTVTSVQAVSINDTPTISGTLAHQMTSDTVPIYPFAAVAIGDADVGQTETATVSFAAADGTVSDGTGTVEAGRYAVSGTTSQVQAALRGLAFAPTIGLAPPGLTVTTGFNLAVNDGFTTAVDSTTSVVVDSITCYVAGTRILTLGGETPVEELAIGDLVQARHAGLAPIKWIGRRHVDCGRHPDPRKVWPVRIQVDAFGDRMPHRDLWLSPDHAVSVDGVLIAIRQLVNGTSIAQIEMATATYFHIELDRHDVLLAEGLPAESYLDTGNRAAFENAGSSVQLHPDFSPTGQEQRESGSCAPLVTEAARVEPIWHRLAANAAALGRPVSLPVAIKNPDLRLLVAGRDVKAAEAADGRYVFVLPPRTDQVQLTSRAGAPADLRPWLDDRRRLGVAVSRIVLHGTGVRTDIAADHPALMDGWHDVEHADDRLWRWTDGAAMVQVPIGTKMVEIHLAGCGEYPAAEIAGLALRLSA